MEGRQRLAILWKLVYLLQDTGKIKLQKLVYLLQEAKGVPLGYSYRLHHYGPFSVELENDVADLMSKGYVKVTADPGGYGYHVQVEDEAPHNVDELAGQYIPDVQALFDAFGKRDRPTLELMATIHFVNSILGCPGKGRLTQEVKLLKPQFSQDYIESMAQDMQKNGLL